MEITKLSTTEFKDALLRIDRTKAAEIFEHFYTLESSFDILEALAVRALEEIGAGWEDGTISLSQVYMAGVICEELIDKYLPQMMVLRKEAPKMAIAVLLDHHALGKRIVYSIIRAGGYEIMDFGQGLSVEELAAKTMEARIEVLLVSTLMLPSALKIKGLKELLDSRGAATKVIVGGAPFRLDKNLWKEVGADADGKNASNIIAIIEALLKGAE
jgi:methanogenic corrinoid protein MtbC1